MSKRTILDCDAKEYVNAYACILEKMICGMLGANLGESISANFIRQMIPHHRGAIEMAKNILCYTDNCKLQAIAKNIIEEQTRSIDNMQNALCCCVEVSNSCSDLCEFQCRMNTIMKNMFEEMNCAGVDNNTDCDFIREMIPHHMGAVKMSETALCYCICDELKPILEAIILSQERGIAQMEELSNCLGCCCC